MTYRLLSLASILCALGALAGALTGCAGLTGPVVMGADAAVIYVTKPGKPPAADVADQIPPHQSWCYQTMGDAQCFAHPQNVPPERLINVDPPSSYPVDLAAYHEALITRPTTVAAVTPPEQPEQAVIVKSAPEAVAATQATGQPVVIDAPAMTPPDIQAEKATLKDELSHDDVMAAPEPPIVPGR